MKLPEILGGGFVVYHGQCCVIHCKDAGQNFSVFQGVTVGRNPSHTKGVQISAGTIVLENIPDNCIVAGNPAKIVKICDNVGDQVWNGNF